MPKVAERAWLVSGLAPWQDASMASPSTPPGASPLAGGALIALGCVGGAAIGFVAREPTIGFLVGLGLGIALSLAIWWRGRAP